MPRFYENLIAQQSSALSREEYAEGQVLFQRNFGEMGKTQRVGGVCCAVSFLGLFFCMLQEMQARNWLFSFLFLLLLMFIGYMLYFCFIRQGEVERTAAGLYYDSHSLPGTDEEILAYRDSFEVKNQYETMTGFWTECAGACRRGDTLIVSTASNLSRSMLLFQEAAMGDGEFERLCAHLQSVFGKRYQSISGGGKK